MWIYTPPKSLKIEFCKYLEFKDTNVNQVWKGHLIEENKGPMYNCQLHFSMMSEGSYCYLLKDDAIQLLLSAP
jgi:hypothetical protein